MASLSAKALTAEIETLLSEKNAGYTEYQESKRRVNELLTIRRSIDQVLPGAHPASDVMNITDNITLAVSGCFK